MRKVIFTHELLQLCHPVTLLQLACNDNRWKKNHESHFTHCPMVNLIYCFEFCSNSILIGDFAIGLCTREHAFNLTEKAAQQKIDFLLNCTFDHGNPLKSIWSTNYVWLIPFLKRESFNSKFFFNILSSTLLVESDTNCLNDDMRIKTLSVEMVMRQKVSHAE